MSESQQAACKKTDPGYTAQMFEDDIGEDFLGSWKSAPLKIDASLDLDNDGPPKAKKKPFSLDKLDADFDFDFSGSFGKLSTFNIDMSDLDFRSPTIKKQKSKNKVQEKSEEGNEEGKIDSFKFELDLKRLDGFDVDNTLPKGEEEKNNLVQDRLSNCSDEYSENVLKSKNKVSPKTIDDVSEINEVGTSPKEQTVTQSKFDQCEFNMKAVELSQGVAESPCTSGSKDVGHSPNKQTTAVKENVVADSCLFENLLQQADSDTMKEATNLPDNVASSPASSIQSGSGDKFSLQNTLPLVVKHASQDSQQGDQVQCFVKADPSNVETPNPDSYFKNPSPEKKELSKCSPGKYTKECFSKTVAISSAKKIPCVKLNNLVREDMDDNIKWQVGGSQNQESFGKGQHTPSKSPFSKMQREITTQRCLVPSKHELHDKESIDNKISRQGTNVMTVESASGTRENFVQVLSKMDQMPSLTNSVNKMRLETVSTVLQSKAIHQSLRSTRIIKDPFQGGSTLTSTGTKSASRASPWANSLNLPSLQLARPMAANGELQSALKKMQKRQLSSSMATKSLSPSTLVGKKIQVSTEQKNKALYPAPLKRKPMERPMADAMSTNPLKRLSHPPLIIKSKSTNAVRRSLSYTPQSADKIPDTEHTTLGTVSEEKLPGFEQTEESDIQEKIPNTDGQEEVSRSNQHIDQPLNCLSSCEEYTRDAEDVIMLENDEIAEKAETCSRELENMCKMLKKTHEEAKDLLVRALVNNNLLLMLNHPLHEEKIQTIQKYVADMFAEDCGK